jgi:hypothetical protein
MRHIRIPFLVIALSLTLTGMAFAINLPELTTWNVNAVFVPGITVTGVGGGGPGLGDLLIAPLYDVRNLTDSNLPAPAGTTAQTPQYTMFSIVNTDSAYGVIARLRFREWKRSRECLDIDIPLTTNDVWVGEVSRVTTGGATLNSPDRWVNALPSPDLFTSDFPTGTFPTAGIAFRSFALESPQDITRCEYGYIEIIGEERVRAMTATFTMPRLAAGVDRDVKNVLMGNVVLLRDNTKISHQYNMTAIANFAVDTLGIWDSPTTAYPNLLNDVQGEGTNPGAGGFNDLEALLSKRFVYYQYAAQGVLGGYDAADPSKTPMSTSVVITFPTKHFHYSTVSPFPIVTAYPFGPPFTGARETLGDGPVYGEVIFSSIWNRSEVPLTLPTTPISPSLTGDIPRLPYEVNVIGLYPTDPAPSAPIFRNNITFATASIASGQTFYSGWGKIDLSPPLFPINETRTLPQGESGIVFNFYNNFFTAYRGLPALGIVMTEFYNGSNSGYYGNTVPWQYEVDWRWVPPDTFIR